MLLNNQLAILGLAVLLGGVSNLGVIGAKAYLLSLTDPVYVVVISISAVVVFGIYLRFANQIQTRFTKGFATLMLVYTGLLGLLTFPQTIPLERGVAWCFLAVFGLSYFWWVLLELSVRYLDPVRSKSYFFYVGTAFEVGVLSTGLLLQYVALTPTEVLYLSVAILIGCTLIVAIQFFPLQNLEVHFPLTQTTAIYRKECDLKAILLWVALLSFCVVGMKTTNEYLVSLVLKEELQSYAAIQEMLARYFVIASILTVIGSVGAGVFMAYFASSPFVFLAVQWLLMTLALLVCLWNPTLYVLLGFEMIRRVSSHIFLRPANQVIFSGFIASFRDRLRAYDNVAGLVLAGVPLAGLFYFIHDLSYADTRNLLFVLILGILAVNVWALWRYRRKLIHVLYQITFSLQLPLAALAVHLLRVLKPADFTAQMKRLLRLSLALRLRKAVILGVGQLEQEEVADLMKEEFKSPQEEIQLSVLDALKKTKSYQARRFLLNVMTSKIPHKSLRVRIHATDIIAKLFGKAIIPFLLKGLDDPDPRIVANTLDTLSIYKDKRLIPFFKQALRSQVPRIAANALLGLAAFPETMELYHDEMEILFYKGNQDMINALVYVIGKRKDRHYHPKLRELYQSKEKQSESFKSILAWALIQLDDVDGYDLTGEQLILSHGGEHPLPIIHFFAQLKQEKQFDVLRYLAVKYQQEEESLRNIENNLRNSLFDFNSELEYFDLSILALKKQT